MPFGATSMSRLSGALPQTIQAAVALERAVNEAGGDLTVPDYGGFRTFDQQAQLVRWRDEAVARGEPSYAVAPAGSSEHETGRAFDVHVVRPVTGLTADQTYRWMADQAPRFGLRAGYWFGGGPPSLRSDPFHFELIAATLPPVTIADVPSEPVSATDPPWRFANTDPPPESIAPGEPGSGNDLMVGRLVLALAGAGVLLAWFLFGGRGPRTNP